MSRCYACVQENCGYGKCDCGCHGDDNPQQPKTAPPVAVIDDREKAWRAYVGGYMKMLNKQAGFQTGILSKFDFDQLNEKGQAEVKADFEQWWRDNQG